MNFNGLSKETKEMRLAKLDERQRLAKGVLHLGAHLGQESGSYAAASLPVLWVEALPHIYARLQQRLLAYPDQRALCAVLGDEDGKLVKFNVSNNWEGVSSSLFPFGPYGSGEHSLWPEIGLTMIDSQTLPMTTLDRLAVSARVDLSQFDYWVLDLQGAEMLALKGAEDSLRYCTSMLVEISQQCVYEGGVLWTDLNRHILAKGFRPLWNPEKIHDEVLFVRDTQKSA